MGRPLRAGRSYAHHVVLLMAETSLHLVDDILPRAPTRQWVLSYPMPLRFVLAYNAEACSVALNVFVAEVFRYLRHKAKQELGLRSVELAHPGSVTVIQRAGGAGNCNAEVRVAAHDRRRKEHNSSSSVQTSFPMPSGKLDRCDRHWHRGAIADTSAAIAMRTGGIQRHKSLRPIEPKGDRQGN